jgi:hypothetical protein
MNYSDQAKRLLELILETAYLEHQSVVEQSACSEVATQLPIGLVARPEQLESAAIGSVAVGHLSLEWQQVQLVAIQVVLEAAEEKQRKDSVGQDFASAAHHYSCQRKVLQAGLRVARSQWEVHLRLAVLLRCHSAHPAYYSDYPDLAGQYLVEHQGSALPCLPEQRV